MMTWFCALFQSFQLIAPDNCENAYVVFSLRSTDILYILQYINQHCAYYTCYIWLLLAIIIIVSCYRFVTRVITNCMGVNSLWSVSVLYRLYDSRYSYCVLKSYRYQCHLLYTQGRITSLTTTTSLLKPANLIVQLIDVIKSCNFDIEKSLHT